MTYTDQELIIEYLCVILRQHKDRIAVLSNYLDHETKLRAALQTEMYIKNKKAKKTRNALQSDETN